MQRQIDMRGQPYHVIDQPSTSIIVFLLEGIHPSRVIASIEWECYSVINQ